MEGEIRLTVDELMREELKNLKMVSLCLFYISMVIIFTYVIQAVDRDKGKGKKGKKGKKKKKKKAKKVCS